MTEYGIIPTGFNRKRLGPLLTEQQGVFTGAFGDNFDVDPDSADGEVIGALAESYASLWELAEACYNAFNPSAAGGAALKNLVQLNGIRALEATRSRVAINVTGTAGVVIAINSPISVSDSSSKFQTEAAITIGVGGTGSGFAVAVETGPVSAAIGTVIIIDEPVTGWATVTNPTSAVEGTNAESDAQLRARRERSTSISSQALIDSQTSAIGNLDGVTRVDGLENDTASVDVNGQAANSSQMIVVGGVDQEIIDSIWLNKCTGIPTVGNTSGVAIDSQGRSHTLFFTRPIQVDIYVEVRLIPDSFPATGEADMKQAIVDYANGLLVPGRGFSLGDAVIASRLYTPANSIPGHDTVQIRISTSPNPTTDINIPIAGNSISHFTVPNIAIVIVG